MGGDPWVVHSGTRRYLMRSIHGALVIAFTLLFCGTVHAKKPQAQVSFNYADLKEIQHAAILPSGVRLMRISAGGQKMDFKMGHPSAKALEDAIEAHGAKLGLFNQTRLVATDGAADEGITETAALTQMYKEMNQKFEGNEDGLAAIGGVVKMFKDTKNIKSAHRDAMRKMLTDYNAKHGTDIDAYWVIDLQRMEFSGGVVPQPPMEILALYLVNLDGEGVEYTAILSTTNRGAAADNIPFLLGKFKEKSDKAAAARAK